MFDASKLDLTALPFVAITDRRALPTCQGVYFASIPGAVLYIGKAVNIQARWLVHDRLADIREWPGVTISWLAIEGDSQLINEIEQACISHFSPRLNKPMGNPQAKKEGASKRTFRFSDDLIARVTRIAQTESRTITAQIEVFLWDKVRQYEKAQVVEGKEPGNSQPEALAA